MKALAYVHGAQRIVDLGQAFVRGCAAHGVPCEVRRADAFKGPEPADVVWLYGLGEGKKVFEAYPGKLRVIGDVRYWRELMPRVPGVKRFARVSVNGGQLGALMNRRPHPPERFRKLNIACHPVAVRGDYVLITGHSMTAAAVAGMAYGQWERETVARLRAVTTRPIAIRVKPKNPPIEVDGVELLPGGSAEAIRGAWAVVCRSGNIGADAILHGIPCYAESGPGAVYQRGRLEDIDVAEPLSAVERESALADIASWQYATEEIAAGLLWAHLRDEGLLCATS